MFNPFNNSIGESLSAADLHQLVARRVAEGLYVEYKSDFPSNNIKIARSIASFANSYGGWYIVGIEASTPENLPTKLVGVDLAKYPDPISKVRDTAKEYIDPLPAFFQQLVPLSPDRSVLVVQIPNDQDKPFVTKDGRIYRRAADSSEPVFEKDRYTIDRLYAEGKRFRKSFLELRKEQSQLSRGEPLLNLLVVPYPNVVNKTETLVVEKVAELLDRSKQPFKVACFGNEFEANMPLNTGYASGQSLIFRQVSPQSGHYRGTSLQFGLRSGSARFKIPLCFLSVEDTSNLENTEVREIFDTLVCPLHLLDIGTTLLMLGSLISFYLHWLGDQPLISEFRFACTLNGMKDVLPFFDDSEWALHVEKFGLPISHHKQIHVPANGWYTWDQSSEVPLWHLIAIFISYSVGVTEDIFGHALSAAMKRFQNAGGTVTSKWGKVASSGF